MSQFKSIIAAHSQEMFPIPTDVLARLTPLSCIRAVMFDVYGTLLVSGSGDVGTSMRMARSTAVQEALAACGLTTNQSSEIILQAFYATIAEDHAAGKEAGVPFPEIVVEDIWSRVLRDADIQALRDHDAGFDSRKFAIEFECRVNPTWPMPGMRQALQQLHARGVRLGLISNAQFFTPLLLEHFLQTELSQAGIEPELCFYSYERCGAKPGKMLYEEAAIALKAAGIDVCHTLYVGNDMLNDIWPADAVGMKTALFAGDSRSLRLREEDSRVADVRPDLVITSLEDILTCLAD